MGEQQTATSNQRMPWWVRACRDSDLLAIADVIHLYDRAGGLTSRATLDDPQQHFGTPGLPPERQVLGVGKAGSAASEVDDLGNVPDRALLGFERAFPGGATPGERGYDLMLRVHPDARSYGLEETIARRLIEIVRSHEAE